LRVRFCLHRIPSSWLRGLIPYYLLDQKFRAGRMRPVAW